ncbi:hypothetical protein B0F90DRAFT_1917640 [Multifurca ochricompacta]|uniref:Uncharacterized protein n=1 Tax=Multifurca ochricompacta TaxID=376703 RepID=A0AAD4QNI0_9AGAM|nr:hypothetical protein B0F90DRAFT_1917640 [Multifurca ochricompacta]
MHSFRLLSLIMLHHFVQHVGADTSLFIPGFDPQPLSVGNLGTDGQGRTTWEIIPGSLTNTLEDTGFVGTATLVEGPNDAHLTYNNPQLSLTVDIECGISNGLATCTSNEGAQATPFTTEPAIPIVVQGGGPVSGASASASLPLSSSTLATTPPASSASSGFLASSVISKTSAPSASASSTSPNSASSIWKIGQIYLALLYATGVAMATSSKIPWDRLKADTLRAICRDFGANPGKRKREGMLEFLRAVETTGLDDALKLNIEDKDDGSPRRPSAKRARPAEEQPPVVAPAELSPEIAGRPKRKAAPAPATDVPVKSRSKKAKTDAVAPTSKGKKGTEKKGGSGDEEAKEQQETDEVDALADELAENGATVAAGQGVTEAPDEAEPNADAAAAAATVVIETSKVETVISQAA